MFDPYIVAVVFGLSGFLAWLPMPFPLFPILSAVVFPLYPLEASQSAYVLALMVGTVYDLAFALLERGDK